MREKNVMSIEISINVKYNIGDGCLYGGIAMAVKIGIVANKGGSNKSSVALCLADAMRHCKYKVLLIDMDQQCNATSVYDAEIEGVNTLADVLAGECEAKEAIQHTAMGDIIAGDLELAGLETTLNNEINRYELLSEAIAEIDKDYDFIVIDTPPALGVYTINCIMASDGVVVPIKADKFAVDGLKRTIGTINKVKNKSHKKDIKIYGVLLSSYDKRTNLGKSTWENLPAVGKQMGFRVFKTPIRVCQIIPDAQAAQTSIFELDATSNAAKDYAELLRELLEVVKNG